MTRISRILKASASAGMLALATGWAAPAVAQEDQLDRYNLRLMTQIFDGERDFSHTQTAGFARTKHGAQSYVELDYHDGAVAIDSREGLELGKFRNTSGVEAAFLYDYGTHTMSGGNDISDYFNTRIRPFMEGNVTTGKDVKWVQEVPLERLGVGGISSGKANIELARTYFSHEGEDYVLVTYDIPAFRYTAADGTAMIHWGKSAALLDADMGQAFWNATLHRAVAGGTIQDARPYRYAKTIAMTDDDGMPVLNYRDVPQVRDTFDAFYSEGATEALGFSGVAAPDQSPVELSVRLDMLGLALAENSGNQLPQVTGQSQTGSRGKEIADDAATAAGYTGKAATVAKLNFSEARKQEIGLELQSNKAELEQKYTNYERRTQAKAGELASARKDYEAVVEAISNEQSLATDLSNLRQQQDADFQQIQSLLTDQQLTPSGNQQLRELQGRVQSRSAEISALEDIALFDDNPGLIADLERDLQASTQKLSTLEGDYNKLLQEGQQLAGEVVTFEARVTVAEANGITVSKGTFTEKLPSGLRTAMESRAGKIVADFGDELLTSAGDAANLYTSGKAVYNIADAASRDTASGDIALVREYGTAGSLGDLGLDIGFLFLSAATGDVRGFVSDGTAITLGSLADIFVAAKAYRDINRTHVDSLRERNRLYRELTIKMEQRSERDRKRWDLVNAILDSNYTEEEKDRLLAQAKTIDVNSSTYNRLLSDARNNRDTSTQPTPEESRALAQAMLEERRQAREAQQEAERQAALEKAQREEAIRRENERRRTANERLAEDARDKYPKADPEAIRREKERRERQKAEGITVPSGDLTAGIDAIEDILTDPALDDAWIDPYAYFDLDEYQKQKLAQAKKDREEWRKSLRSDPKGDLIGAGVRQYTDADAMLFGDYEIKHTVFTSVDWNAPTFTPPEWKPPEWKPPEFKSPKFSGFDWTNFDDDDWPGAKTNRAFKYENMSGTADVDLDKWEAFIAQHGLDYLNRLARQAGYPSFAFAAADWKNLVRNAGDAGFRQYAQRGPSCAGYAGCGPNFLGRWTQARSQVALGDLIGESGAAISSNGLSDISIQGFLLRFSVFDNALEDGDIVTVTVRQFGRVLFNQTIGLTNAPQTFSVGVQRGRVAVDLRAENTGEFPPNTASLVIDGVTDGEGNQDYAADEGETASLVVNVGRQPGS